MKKRYVGLDRSSLKLIINNDSVVIDEKNRRVIHTIDWTLKIPNVFENIIWSICNGPVYKMNGRAKGVAICHEGDTFDIELGKKMARAIAESNAYTNASKRVKKIMHNVFRIANEINEQELDFRIKANEIVVHNKEYMDGLLSK